ncbi:MAG: arginyltransferase [Nitrospirae bacterium]|nr:arginyltransferase [Nitrospirota bacterium]
MTENQLKQKTDTEISFQEDSTCPYFDDGRTSSIEYLIPAKKRIPNFHELLSKGYRRIGSVFYRNVCKTCSACIPLRIEVEKFQLSRSQKRTIGKNKDIRVEVQRRPSITPEKVVLYDKYIAVKHKDDKKEETRNPLPFLLAMHSGYDHIIEMDYYCGGKLIAVGIVDEAADSLSSNYFYYDTDHLDRRPGVFSIIQEIYLARKMGKRYLYLGFYIEENPKMRYKKLFRPNQIYRDDQWQDYLKGQ